MTSGDEIALLIAAAFGLLILGNVVRYVRAEFARHGEPVVVAGHVRLFRPDPLLSDTERRFAEQLEPALPEGSRLLAKCRLIEMLQPVVPEHHRFHDAAKRLILAKDVDFVIADRDWAVLCAVELDDRSHRREDRRQRDRIVDAVFREAGVPLLRVRTDEDWAPASLRHRIAKLLAQPRSVPAPLTRSGSVAASRRRPQGTARE